MSSRKNPPSDAPTPTFDMTPGPPSALHRGDTQDALTLGDHLGRYVVLQRLGAGGLGVVYGAYDPSLDRKVAVKLLRARRFGAALQERLKREAQALAKLNHPNVVTVFDVGRSTGRVFLAMEFVDGEHLGDWLKKQQRSQREILDLFFQAGRGLVHAHGAGVVHRDFKPANVMVSGSRAVVLDFGLARSLESPEATRHLPDRVLDAQALQQHVASEALAIEPNGGGLTRTGAVIGTPAFMAPEQWNGEPATAATDQFSFCVALYLALYGSLPFPESRGESPPDWTLAPPNKAVPKGLRRVLERGLSRRSTDRFPSMDALLDALQAATSRRRRVAWTLATAASLLAIAFGFLWPTSPDLCQAGPDRWAEIWGGPQRVALEEAFAGTKAPFADAVTSAVGHSFDAYGKAWTEMYRDACEATHRRGEQSAQLLDLRMTCLERRRRELDALVRLFGQQPNDTIEQAVRAVGELRPVETCGDAVALRTLQALPNDPQVQQRIEALRDRLDDARALQEAGRFSEALERVQETTTAVHEIDYLPLEAELEGRRGHLYERLGRGGEAAEVLRRAATLGQAAGTDRLAAEALIRLVRVHGYQLADGEEGALHARLAAAVLGRLESADDLQAALADQQGLVARLAGDYSAAESHHERAISVERQRTGGSPVRVATSLIRLGTVQKNQGKLQAAADSFRRALEIQQQHLGEHHPDVAVSLQSLGTVAFELGQVDEAESFYRRALEIFEAVYEDDHLRSAVTRLHLGGVYADRGEHELSLLQYQAAQASLQRLLGAKHPHVAIAWSNVGSTLWEMGELQASADAFETAVSIQEAALGARHPTTASVRVNWCSALNALGHFDEAERQASAALDALQEAHPEGHESVASAWHALGMAQKGQGSTEQALQSLEAAWELWQDITADPRLRAETSWQLAKILIPVDPSRARDFAFEARDLFAQRGLNAKVADVEAWLGDL